MHIVLRSQDLCVLKAKYFLAASAYAEIQMNMKTNTSAKQEQIQLQVKADLFGRLRHLPATYLGKIIAAEGGGMPLLLVKQDTAGF